MHKLRRFAQETHQISWLTTPALTMVVLLIAAASPIKASSQTSSNPTFTFPMAAIIEGQSARLNVVNRTGSPGDLPPDVCDVELQFLDRKGVVRAESTIKGLAPGHAAYLDLSATDLRDQPGRRHELRAFVRVSEVSGLLPPDVCEPSLGSLFGIDRRNEVLRLAAGA